jgi:hypothetical protein
MNNAIFFHEYPGKRDPLASINCTYIGPLGTGLQSKIIIGETPLNTFSTDSGHDRAWAPALLESYSDAEIIILTIPKASYLFGDGLGYTLELTDYFKEFGFHVNRYAFEFPHLGAPIQGSTGFILATKEVHTPIKALMRTEVSVSTILPDIITHAPKFIQKVAFVSGTGALNGFLKSHTHPLPVLLEWQGVPLLCERRTGNTLILDRISCAEVATLYGVEVKSLDSLEPLLKVVPNLVYDTFIGRVLSL